MASEPNLPVHELRSLALRYAEAADGGDPDGFAAVFHPDAELMVWRPGDVDPSSVRRGRAALAEVPVALRRYRSTDHRVGPAEYRFLDDGLVEGDVHCEAHHVSVEADGTTDAVMTITYGDVYRLGSDGVWRIARRCVRIHSVDVVRTGAVSDDGGRP